MRDMRTGRVCTKALPDEELRRLLRAGETIIFKGAEVRWQQVERQVEDLGFGEAFCVSFAKGPNEDGVTKVSPIRPRTTAAS